MSSLRLALAASLAEAQRNGASGGISRGSKGERKRKRKAAEMTRSEQSPAKGAAHRQGGQDENATEPGSAPRISEPSSRTASSDGEMTVTGPNDSEVSPPRMIQPSEDEDISRWRSLQKGRLKVGKRPLSPNGMKTASKAVDLAVAVEPVKATKSPRSSPPRHDKEASPSAEERQQEPEENGAPDSITNEEVEVPAGATTPPEEEAAADEIMDEVVEESGTEASEKSEERCEEGGDGGKEGKTAAAPVAGSSDASAGNDDGDLEVEHATSSEEDVKDFLSPDAPASPGKGAMTSNDVSGTRPSRKRARSVSSTGAADLGTRGRRTETPGSTKGTAIVRNGEVQSSGALESASAAVEAGESLTPGVVVDRQDNSSSPEPKRFRSAQAPEGSEAKASDTNGEAPDDVALSAPEKDLEGDGSSEKLEKEASEGAPENHQRPTADDSLVRHDAKGVESPKAGSSEDFSSNSLSDRVPDDFATEDASDTRMTDSESSETSQAESVTSPGASSVSNEAKLTMHLEGAKKRSQENAAPLTPGLRIDLGSISSATEGRSAAAGVASPPRANQAENLSSLSSTPTSSMLSPGSTTPRTSRAAAIAAKTRISSQSDPKRGAKGDAKEAQTAEVQKDLPKSDSPPGTKRRSRKRKKETCWVACDACGKWRRLLLTDEEKQQLPELWYCRLNASDPRRSTCDAPEEDDSQAKSRDLGMNSRLQASLAAANPDSISSADLQTEVVPQEAGEGDGTAGRSGDVKTRNQGVSATNVKWVACDKCSKWRMVPSFVDTAALPDKWYCSMNAWDPSRADCGVPEDDESTVGSWYSRFVQTQKSSTTATKRKSGRPPKNKGASSGGKAATGQDQLCHGGTTPSELSTRNRSGGAVVPSVRYNGNGHGGAASPAKPGKEEKKKEISNWVQCEKCKKWRRLQAGMEPEKLPERWFCHMNYWDSLRNHCAAPQEKEETTASVRNRQGGITNNIMSTGPRSRSLSYREIIFGSDGRVRAAFAGRGGAHISSMFMIEGINESGLGRETTAYDCTSLYVIPKAKPKKGGRKAAAQSASSKAQNGPSDSGSCSDASSSIQGPRGMSSKAEKPSPPPGALPGVGAFLKTQLLPSPAQLERIQKSEGLSGPLKLKKPWKRVQMRV
mmetsp:Transcript_4763/g.19070  ORF Transcript_4763/g.19070 Transcript_4763/m.19070 type:complete len:1137 (-) Transcript_4763:249-3659(-)